ncbi:MAG: pentapeptide repeat-containing protein [Cyanobacteria bacterium J06643_5]
MSLEVFVVAFMSNAASNTAFGVTSSISYESFKAVIREIRQNKKVKQDLEKVLEISFLNAQKIIAKKCLKELKQETKFIFFTSKKNKTDIKSIKQKIKNIEKQKRQAKKKEITHRRIEFEQLDDLITQLFESNHQYQQRKQHYIDKLVKEAEEECDVNIYFDKLRDKEEGLCQELPNQFLKQIKKNEELYRIFISQSVARNNKSTQKILDLLEQILKVIEKLSLISLVLFLFIVIIYVLQDSKIEQWVLERTDSKLFDRVEAFIVIIGLSFLILEIPNKRNNQREIANFEAWQLINSTQNQKGICGRIQALENLNRNGVYLAYITITDAHLKGIKLQKANLVEANFKGTNLSHANLSKANLSDTNLSDANLSYADLSKANLSYADLRNADLYYADLRNAELQKADLRGANLRCAKLKNAKHIKIARIKGCLYNRRTEFPTDFLSEKKHQMYQISPEVDLRKLDLRGFNLYEANLIGANLSKANLRKADLSNADLKNVVLSESDLREANLKGADLTNVRFDGSLYDIKTQFPDKFEPEEYHMYFICESANLQNADLREAQFNGVNLKDASFKGADLTNAQFKDTLLNNADLNNANLNGADLTNADLSNANLSGANLNGCLYNEKTKFPLHFNPHHHLMYLICAKTDLSNQDLSGCHLNDADLKGANLKNANLKGADLRKADLKGANLKNANLKGADLRKADLRDANLRGTILIQANLTGAKLRHCLRDDKTQLPNNYYIGDSQTYLIVPETDLRACTLTSANLEDADLRKADLSNANLDNANLRGARLSYANLEGAKLRNANLSNANLSNADLENVNLSNADLTNTNLNRVNFKSADLSNTNLSGADLTYAENLTTEQVKSAFYWSRARYNKNLRRKLGSP